MIPSPQKIFILIINVIIITVCYQKRWNNNKDEKDEIITEKDEK